MSRRLQADIEKTTREAKVSLDSYDDRWHDLREFNRTQQQGLKDQMWQDARREQMRGKKHAVRTATLELLDFKHVCDSKGKIESELESCLRRLHRLKSQLAEWLNLSELRTQYDELRDLKKQIDLRYKRGRIFYCSGQSSEEPPMRSAELSREAAEQAKLISSVVLQLKSQMEDWQAELDGAGESGEETPVERRTQLMAFLDLHVLHLSKLSCIVDAIGSKGFVIPRQTSRELLEGLRQYSEQNESLSVVVAEEIYHDIPPSVFASDDLFDEEDHTTDSCARESPPSGNQDAGGEVQSPRQDSIKSDSIKSGSSSLKLDSLPGQDSSRLEPEIQLTDETISSAVLPLPKRVESGSSIPDGPNGKSPIRVLRRRQQQGLNKDEGTEGQTQSMMNTSSSFYNLQLITAIDRAACDWSYAGRGLPADTATANKTLSVKEGDNLYIIKLDKSGWSFAFAEGPSSDTLATLTPRKTHLKAEAITKLRGGWFPDSVRVSVRQSAVEEQQKRRRKHAAAAGGATRTSRIPFPSLEDIQSFALNGEDKVPLISPKTSPDSSLLERLEILGDRAEKSFRMRLPPMRVVASLEPGSVRVVQWPWKATQLLFEEEKEVVVDSSVFLQVSKGDRVWISRFSEDGNWVEGVRLMANKGGWFPASQFASPQDLMDLLAAYEHLTT